MSRRLISGLSHKALQGNIDVRAGFAITQDSRVELIDSVHSAHNVCVIAILLSTL